ncbi:flagellar hook-associated protein FlgK [Geodermatophilus sp. YIM 151500]|uniref:flagellar hook-associated protein FlgK n=1 Tax=Geodermatophilus sp. YIM 151500 TaxID=2984531 RepID=UPI0021E44B3E|nr:flagellar hook-associated protein FlgK [Geodermatophilus sp. YIM 151500]MCV2489481.1 flagellar hook-associated protein FlgK [Geodermatophilus sp. YIM 151500]
MGSTFSGLNAATTALWAQRRGLDVTGQNIANVNTEGYSRQRADLQAMGGSPVPAFYSVSDGIGAGVRADQVVRIRDAFLEGRGHTEHANSARLTAEAEAYELVEQAFREPGDTGIQSLLSEMWAGFSDLANTPQELGAREQVLERLETLAGGLRFSASSLGAQWDQAHENLQVLVDDVNAAARSVAELNQAIQRATQSGRPSNDLADKRDVLVMKLAEQVGATVRPGEDGVLDVLVGGITLVAGSTATALAVAGPTSPDAITASDKPRVVTAAGGHAVRTGGTAEGRLTALTTILPGYRTQLDDLAAGLAATLNGAHDDGFDLDGLVGGALLGSTSGPVTASSITVLVTDPRKLAASGVAPTAGVPALDNGNADAIAQLRLAAGSADETYRSMIVQLGVQASVATRDLGIQSVITTQVDAARESVAGVNLDEEMTNMLAFQHAYAAAGRLVTAIDETLDVLINRTGIVGR